jgi:hypothetical protein
MAQALVERFDSEVPHRNEDLVTLPGSVARRERDPSVALDEPGLRWTPVGRLSVRSLGAVVR